VLIDQSHVRECISNNTNYTAILQSDKSYTEIASQILTPIIVIPLFAAGGQSTLFGSSLSIQADVSPTIWSGDRYSVHIEKSASSNQIQHDSFLF